MKKKRTKNKLRTLLTDEKGFNLIELMITTVVVVLALVGYVSANTAIQQRSESQFERSLAAQDANQVIERMRDAAEAGEFPGNVTAAFPDNGTVAGFTGLDGQQVTVSYADPSVDPLDATVTVTWNENGRRPATLSLRTLITQRVPS